MGRHRSGERDVARGCASAREVGKGDGGGGADAEQGRHCVSFVLPQFECLPRLRG